MTAEEIRVEELHETQREIRIQMIQQVKAHLDRGEES